MTDDAVSGLDDAAMAFAARVFDLARHGDAAELAAWLDEGLPAVAERAAGHGKLH